jgi:hypothetical protein
LGGDRRAQAAWKRSRESYKDTLDLFLTLVYLKNKKPKKKKKKKLYVQSQTETTDYGKRQEL